LGQQKAELLPAGKTQCPLITSSCSPVTKATKTRLWLLHVPPYIRLFTGYRPALPFTYPSVVPRIPPIRDAASNGNLDLHPLLTNLSVSLPFPPSLSSYLPLFLPPFLSLSFFLSFLWKSVLLIHFLDGLACYVIFVIFSRVLLQIH
jgi:hypothetical protein